MWELDCEESWVLKNWCFWTVVMEKTLESPLDCKEIQPFHSEGDQPWNFFGWNDAKAETPVLWSPHAKGWLIGKDSDAGRAWGQEKKGTTEDEIADWHHWLDGRLSELWELVMDRETWRAAIHGVAKSLSDWTETQHTSFAINIPLTNRSQIIILPMASSCGLRAHAGTFFVKILEQMSVVILSIISGYNCRRLCAFSCFSQAQ